MASRRERAGGETADRHPVGGGGGPRQLVRDPVRPEGERHEGRRPRRDAGRPQRRHRRGQLGHDHEEERRHDRRSQAPGRLRRARAPSPPGAPRSSASPPRITASAHAVGQPGGPRPASHRASATHTGATKTSSTTVGAGARDSASNSPRPAAAKATPAAMPRASSRAGIPAAGCAAQTALSSEGRHQQAHAEQGRRVRAELVRSPREHRDGPERQSPQRARGPRVARARTLPARGRTRTSHDRRVVGMRRERASSAPAAREIVVASWELSTDGARS